MGSGVFLLFTVSFCFVARIMFFCLAIFSSMLAKSWRQRATVFGEVVQLYDVKGDGKLKKQADVLVHRHEHARISMCACACVCGGQGISRERDVGWAGRGKDKQK